MSPTPPASSPRSPARRWTRWVARAAVVVLAVVVATALSGLAYEYFAARDDERDHPAPGRLVTVVDGHRMHVDCTGAGDGPTVVLDAGLGGFSMDWALVQPGIAAFARVCSYDRPGIGWSDPVPGPRGADVQAGELHAMLEVAGITGPLVLVGHSNGGLRVLRFAARFPDEVAGVVLVDPTPIASDEEQQAALTPAEHAEFVVLATHAGSTGEDGSTLRMLAMLQPFGVPRLLVDGLLAGSVSPYLPPELRPRYRAAVNRARFLSTLVAETNARTVSIAEVRELASLGDVPLTVLTKDHLTGFAADPVPPELTGRLGVLVDRMGTAAGNAFAGLSTRGTAERVTGSGHYILIDRLDAVVDAVRRTLVSCIGSSCNKSGDPGGAWQGAARSSYRAYPQGRQRR